MTQTGQINSAVFDFYLKLLHVPSGKADKSLLTSITSAHLDRFPFENISKLYYKRREGLTSLIGLERYLDGAAKYNFGGTCYPNNYYLGLLLRHLGFEVRLCGADMKQSDVHNVAVVTLDDREYLVDVGYAAPFLEPMPLDLETDYLITLAEDTYALHPRDAEGRTRLDMCRGQDVIHGYRINPRPRSVEEFSGVVADSFAPTATFMNTILLTRYSRARSVRITSNSIRVIHGAEISVYPLNSLDQLIEAITTHFGIPTDICRQALDGIDLANDARN